MSVQQNLYEIGVEYKEVIYNGVSKTRAIMLTFESIYFYKSDCSYRNQNYFGN